MGGYYYTTEQGDMWDYIAWKVYGDEMLIGKLMEAPENRKLLQTYMFSQGTEVWCPYIEENSEDTDWPDWRDEE